MVTVMMAMPHQWPTDERRSQIKWTSVRNACMAAATAAGTIKSQRLARGSASQRNRLQRSTAQDSTARRPGTQHAHPVGGQQQTVWRRRAGDGGGGGGGGDIMAGTEARRQSNRGAPTPAPMPFDKSALRGSPAREVPHRQPWSVDSVDSVNRRQSVKSPRDTVTPYPAIATGNPAPVPASVPASVPAPMQPSVSLPALSTASQPPINTPQYHRRPPRSGSCLTTLGAISLNRAGGQNTCRRAPSRSSCCYFSCSTSPSPPGAPACQPWTSRPAEQRLPWLPWQPWHHCIILCRPVARLSRRRPTESADANLLAALPRSLLLVHAHRLHAEERLSRNHSHRPSAANPINLPPTSHPPPAGKDQPHFFRLFSFPAICTMLS